MPTIFIAYYCVIMIQKIIWLIGSLLVSGRAIPSFLFPFSYSPVTLTLSPLIHLALDYTQKELTVANCIEWPPYVAQPGKKMNVFVG